MRKIKFSLVIPCYNEEKNIPLIIEKLKEILNRTDLEIILVDNGSVDGSHEIIKNYSKKYKAIKMVYIKKNIGYGFGIFSGLKTAKGEFIGWTHADLQTDPIDYLRAYEIIKDQKEKEKIYVKGKRYGRPISDSFFTFGMSIFATIFLKKFLYDINAQPNLFHRSFLRLVKEPPKDFSFDLYFFYLAKINGYNCIRFPVFFGKRLYGNSKWNFGIKSRIKFIKRTIIFILNLKKYIENAKNSS